MGLFTKLKSLLGLEDDHSEVRRSESGVTIEREPNESAEPSLKGENTGKGVDTSAEGPSETSELDEIADTDEAAVEISGSTEDVVTQPEAENSETELDEAAKHQEATDTSADSTEPEQNVDIEPESTFEDTENEMVSESGDATEGQPLEDIKGIGPAYAEQLRDAGVANTAELAKADPDSLAEKTSLSTKRISTWIDRVQSP